MSNKIETTTKRNGFAEYNEIRKALLQEKHNLNIEQMKQEHEWKRQEHEWLFAEHQARFAMLVSYNIFNPPCAGPEVQDDNIYTIHN